MEDAYLNRLPADVRQLVEEIEEKAGIEIEIRIDPERARQQCDGPTPMACEADERGAWILIASRDDFPESSVLHELFHIHRILIEQVPKLVVCDDLWDRETDRAYELDRGIHALDNNIEHLAIVPRELRLRPDRGDWWAGRFGRVLEKLASGQFAEQMQRDNNAFVAWVSIKHILGEGNLLENARQIFERLALLQRAENLYRDVSQSEGSKVTISRAWLQAIDLPRKYICFEYTNIYDHSTEEVPMESE